MAKQSDKQIDMESLPVARGLMQQALAEGWNDVLVRLTKLKDGTYGYVALGKPPGRNRVVAIKSTSFGRAKGG